MDAEERNRVIRSMIQHEDHLRDQRLGWLLTFNGFLFATFGLAWDHPETEGLIAVVSCLGLVVALSAMATMRVSDEAIRRLAGLAADDARKGGAGDEVALPLVQAMDSAYLRGLPGPTRFLPRLYIWNLVPRALAVAWLFALGTLVLR